MHGLSGTSAVVALIPVTLIHRLGLGFGYLIAFGLGVTLGMVLYAAIAALAMRYATEQSVRWGRWIASGIGLTGIAVGTWWVVEALGRMS
jgi:cytochrome c biogenesis protein CcdA